MLKMLKLDGPARSAAFSPEGDLMAVGMKNGEFILLDCTNLKILARKRDRGQAIQDLR